ncbi:MAG: hypothetical protein LBI30_02565 [Holosporales bacterium]|nr:hypothetical protein [Holosporales bacterium]
MDISKQSLEVLLDLVEIKLEALLIQDRDDLKELNRLKSCRKELSGLIETKKIGRGQEQVKSRAII